MPRPSKRKQTVVVAVAMEYELAILLTKLAREWGISRSELIERLLREALGPRAAGIEKLEIPSDPLSPADPDPLTLVECEDLEAFIDSIEKRVEKLEERARALPAGGYRFRDPRTLRDVDLREWVRDLQGDWYRAARRYKELRSRVPAEWNRKVNEKLADLKRRINAIYKLLYKR